MQHVIAIYARGSSPCRFSRNLDPDFPCTSAQSREFSFPSENKLLVDLHRAFNYSSSLRPLPVYRRLIRFSHVRMAYPSRSAKYTCPTYHIITREPKVKGSGTSGSARHRPPPTPLGSRSSSGTQIVTPKALVRKKSTNFDHAQSNYSAVQSSQSFHGSSKASTPADTKTIVKEYFDDWDDGNITVQRGSSTCQDEVTIHVNRPSILRLRGRSRSNDWEVVELSDVRLGKKPIRASSVGDLRKEDRKELKDQVDKAEPFNPETDLAGLATCMRLESHLRHLKRILRLFLDFDELTRGRCLPILVRSY